MNRLTEFQGKMLNKLGLYAGAALLAAVSATGADAALPTGSGNASSLYAQEAPCPPFDTAASPGAHHSRPHLHKAAVAHAVAPRPVVIPAVIHPHPIHRKPRPKPVAFAAPAFLKPAVLRPGRCEVLQRPDGYGPQLMSYLPPEAAAPVLSNSPTNVPDVSTPSPLAVPRDERLTSLVPPVDGGPTGIVPSATGAPGTSTTPSPSDPSVSAVPEPGTWALMLVGVLGVGCALRRNRALAARLNDAPASTEA